MEKRKNRKNEKFNVLILQENVEVVISKTTGRPYLTDRKYENGIIIIMGAKSSASFLRNDNVFAG
jgi:hypothetical protein